ncbi:hypothetical protein ACYX7E_02530 [Luteimonas sp. RIT-PG2_3]
MSRKLWKALALGIAAAIIGVMYMQWRSIKVDDTETLAQEHGDSAHVLEPAGRARSVAPESAVDESSTGADLAASARAPLDGALHTPTPMSAENARRVSRFSEGLAMNSERQKEFLTLATNEEKDPQWSPQMQSALTNALNNHYGQRSGLEVSDVHCTRSICTISAVVKDSTSVGQASDWQAWIGPVMNEPWFGDQFFDASTTMGTDDKGLIYVTYFLRKSD